MTPKISELFELFAASLAQVFESMAEQRPEVECNAIGSPEQQQMLWWEQPLQFAPGMKIWTGAKRSTWEYSGALTLKAAGIEDIEEKEARNTYLEILGQALSALARGIGGVLGHEVTCEGGSEHAPDFGTEEWIAVRMTFGSETLEPLVLTFSSQLFGILAAPPVNEVVAPPATIEEDDEDAEPVPMRSRTMSLLLDVDLPVSISFGKTQLAMRDVIKLTTGSIVELDRTVNEPVDVLVNGSLVARGEVVVVEGNYGVRILEITSRQERMRTLR
jgi:flagellar motor switch protein FliN/FliY